MIDSIFLEDFEENPLQTQIKLTSLVFGVERTGETGWEENRSFLSSDTFSYPLLHLLTLFCVAELKFELF